MGSLKPNYGISQFWDLSSQHPGSLNYGISHLSIMVPLNPGISQLWNLWGVASRACRSEADNQNGRCVCDSLVFFFSGVGARGRRPLRIRRPRRGASACGAVPEGREEQEGGPAGCPGGGGGGRGWLLTCQPGGSILLPRTGFARPCASRAWFGSARELHSRN